MEIIAQLKVERDKAAQQMNALDTAIRALSGLNTTSTPGFAALPVVPSEPVAAPALTSDALSFTFPPDVTMVRSQA